MWSLHILAQGRGFLLGAVRGLMCVCVRVNVHVKKICGIQQEPFITQYSLGQTNIIQTDRDGPLVSGSSS